MGFEWDDEKNAINIKKHGVDFEEASSSFYDANALELADREHSGFVKIFMKRRG